MNICSINILKHQITHLLLLNYDLISGAQSSLQALVSIDFFQEKYHELPYDGVLKFHFPLSHITFETSVFSSL